MNLPLIPGSLPADYCPTSYQQMLNDFMAASYALWNDIFQGNIISATQPGPEDRDKVWYKVDSNGDPLGKYTWSARLGRWVWPHLSDAGGSERRIWTGSEANLWYYDGGDGGDPSTVGDCSGPMWLVDTDFGGRSPMGVGDISGSDPAKTIALGENFGEGSYALTQAELPDISLVTSSNSDSDMRIGIGNGGPQGGYTAVYPADSPGVSWSSHADTHTNSIGDGDAHQNTHPVRGCYLIKRSARIYYTP